MTVFQALFIAILQGVTELFPVSSLGHSVILPALLNWNVDLHDISFLPFLTLLHLGTATALLIYFWRDWVVLLNNGLRPASKAPDPVSNQLFWQLVYATLPAIVIGGGFEHIFRAFFGEPTLAAVFLTINGVLLLATERLRNKETGTIELAEMNWRRAVFIGFSQALALFPGISRSGITIMAGLVVGLRHEAAARFSFLLATPIILAATAHEMWKLHQAGGSITGLFVIAAVVAGIAAYGAVAFLMRYFGKNEFKALNPFGYYCIAAGVLSISLLQLL